MNLRRTAASERRETFVRLISDLINNAPTTELAIALKYLSIVSVLTTLSRQARIAYVTDIDRMQRLMDTAIEDFEKLQPILNSYNERSKGDKTN